MQEKEIEYWYDEIVKLESKVRWKKVGQETKTMNQDSGQNTNTQIYEQIAQIANLILAKDPRTNKSKRNIS